MIITIIVRSINASYSLFTIAELCAADAGRDGVLLQAYRGAGGGDFYWVINTPKQDTGWETLPDYSCNHEEYITVDIDDIQMDNLDQDKYESKYFACERRPRRTSL